MEAFATVGIICNAFQLTGYGIVIVQLSREIHEKGISRENEWVLRYTKEMTDVSRLLGEKLTGFKLHRGHTAQEVQICNIAETCRETANQLQKEFEKLQNDPGSTGWRKALLTTVRTLRHQKAIDNLENRLQKQSGLLQTTLTVALHSQLEAIRQQMDGHFLRFEQMLQEFSGDLIGRLDKTLNLLRDSHTDLANMMRRESEKVREEVRLHNDFVQSKAEDQRNSERVLDSLRFTEINDRKNCITESHTKTCEWIFDPKIKTPWDSFASWLEYGKGIYWIHGKPGSGKSVLVKFIFDHEYTQILLEKWATPKPVLNISFFVWKGGVKLQRQKRGLLCSLVLQLAQNSQPYLLKVLSSSDRLSKRSPLDWSVKELLCLLSEFADMSIAKVCVFVDGLDESEAEDGDIGMLHFVETLSRLDGWKICVASRPEPDLRSVLAKYPTLCLQDLTKDDLRRFVCDKLQDTSKHEFFANHDKELVPDELIELVCGKADGVFLWVRFAVMIVIRGARRMNGWQDFKRRLTQLPSELEQLYTDMWQRDGDVWGDSYTEVAKYFKSVLSNKHGHWSCLEFMVSDSKAVQDLVLKTGVCPRPVDLLRECYRTEQRILSVSRGFLESCGSNSTALVFPACDDQQTVCENEISAQIDRFSSRNIFFVHRSAIDFLQKLTAVKTLLSDESFHPYNLATARINGLLVQHYSSVNKGSDLELLFSVIRDNGTSMQEKIAAIRKWELVHDKTVLSKNLSDTMDVTRTWHNTAIESRQARYKSYTIGVLTRKTSPEAKTLRPFQYALGWHSFAAHAGLTAYLKSVLHSKPVGKLNPRYISCLAACTAFGQHFGGLDTTSYTCEIRRLELIEVLEKLGADLNIKYLLNFSSSPVLDVLSMFCTDYRQRLSVPSAQERSYMLSKLRSLLTSGTMLSQKSVHALHLFPYDIEGSPVGISLRAVDGESFDTVSQKYLWIVEFNLSALSRLYAQSLGACEEEVNSLLEGFDLPECRPLAIRPMYELLKFRQLFWGVEESSKFYDRLDRYASYGTFAMAFDFHAGRNVGLQERYANISLSQILDNVFDQKPEDECYLDELMISHGYWHTTSISSSDVPYLQPFDVETVDCSKFMFSDTSETSKAVAAS